MVLNQRARAGIASVEELDDILTTPSDALAVLAQRALDAAGQGRKAIAVSRFSDAAARERLDSAGVTTISADLHDPAALAALPGAPNIVYMLGTKFGTTGREYLTWATNVYLAGKVAERFPNARFTVFSSGNIYPFRPVTQGGATEDVAPDPIGEYAQSCLARERMFEHWSIKNGTPVSIFRLNYAIDLRYGVLYDIASQVHAGEAVDITMGNVNVIWQGDANTIALRALAKASTPPEIINVTGPETIPMRFLVEEFAKRFGVEPKVTGEEAPTALLNNAAKAFGLFGYPSVPLTTMIDWVAAWVEAGGPTLNKPTHFQEREGKF